MAIFPTDPRNLLIDAALVVVHKAANNRSILAVDEEAKKLVDLYPGSGMTVEDVRAYLARAANDKSMAIAFG